MKISLVSDIHAEFGYQELPGGEVLILAGDICELRTLRNEYHTTKTLDRKPGAFKSYDFFYHECAKYEKVFMVLGNHEHYHSRFDKTYDELKAILPANVTLLEKEYVEYKGVIFLGATLWTDLNKHDPITVYTVKDSMHDYRVIQNFYPEKNLYHKLTPDHTHRVHKETLEYFKQTIEANTDKQFVVITHHGPTYMSVHARYKGDYHMNGGFVSDLSNFILDHPNIKFWCHGHVHDPFSYHVGDTRVMANPRGYMPYEKENGFDPNFTVEIA